MHVLTYLPIYLPIDLLMTKFEVQMLLYTLIKIHRSSMKHIKCIWYHIVLQSDGWFDGQDISVEPRRPRFNPFINIYYVEYVYS